MFDYYDNNITSWDYELTVPSTKKNDDDEETRAKKAYEENEKNRVMKSMSEYALRPAQSYQGHEMYFLKTPRVYVFREPVMLAETTYNYRVSKIQEVDIRSINVHFLKMNKKLKMIGNEAFMNGKSIIFMNDAYPDKEITFNNAIRYKLVIQIQGYKSSAGGRTSPIWKILEAHQSI